MFVRCAAAFIAPGYPLSSAAHTLAFSSPLLAHHQIPPAPASAVGEAVIEPPLDEAALADQLRRQSVCAETSADPPVGLAVAAHLEQEPLVNGLVAAEQVELEFESDLQAELTWGVAEPIVSTLDEQQFYRRVIRGLDLDKVSNTASTGVSSPQ